MYLGTSQIKTTFNKAAVDRCKGNTLCSSQCTYFIPKIGHALIAGTQYDDRASVKLLSTCSKRLLIITQLDALLHQLAHQPYTVHTIPGNHITIWISSGIIYSSWCIGTGKRSYRYSLAGSISFQSIGIRQRPGS